MSRVRGKRLFCILLIMALLASPSLAYASEIGGGQGAGALDSPAMAQAALFAVQDGAVNAVEDDVYQDLGFQTLPDQEAFTSSDHPLDGYEGTAMSQLYVGYMNKTKAYTGAYSVYGTMLRRSKQGATISGNGAAGYLDAGFSAAQGEYGAITGVANPQYRTLNTVSLDMGPQQDGTGGKPAVLCEAILLTGKDAGVNNAKKTSYFAVRTLVYDTAKGAYVPRSSYSVKLAGASTAIGSLDVRAAQGLNAVAAGDYNGDGVDELAVYVPHFSEPYIQIFDIGETGSIALGSKIVLNELAAPSDPVQYRLSFTGWNLPIVALATTGIAGHDSLAITACLPRSTDKAYRGHSPLPALALYKRASNGTMTQEYLNHMNYGGYYMRFPSATEADVDGDGINELVVAGYADTWTNPSNTDTTPAKNPFTKYCVNLLVHDGNGYDMAYTTPLEFTPTGNVKKVMAQDSGYAMSEPVALAAARLSEVMQNDYLFLEGAVLLFSKAQAAPKDAGQREKLAGGQLHSRMEMTMQPSGVTVSHAVSGRFAADHPGTEQIALVWHDNFHNLGTAVADANITWIWLENNIVMQHETNPRYLANRDENGSGTFLTLAKVDDNTHKAVFRYDGKSYGWSKPNALVGLPAVPYWKELPYDGGVGEVSFSVGNTLDASLMGSVGMSMGGTLSASAMMGAAALGNKAMAGIGVDFESSISETVELQGALSLGNTQTYSAPGDKNHVLVYATPMVTYQYDVWLPAFTLTQEGVDEYKAITGEDTIQDENGKVYQPGDTVPAGWHSYHMHVPYSPTFSLITMEQYNAAYTKHTLGTGEIDMSAYDFTVGDPSTYKSSFSAINYYNSVLHMVSRPKNIVADDVTNQIEFTGTAGLSGGITVGVQFNAAVKAQISGALELIASVEGEIDFGQTGSFEESVGVSLGFSVNLGTGASINHLPAGYGDYAFTTTMGIWPCAGSGPLLTTGFIVAARENVPPKPPESPYVYETGIGPDGQAFVVLAWPQPQAQDYRLARAYEVHGKLATAAITDYTKLGSVNVLEQNFFLVTGLTPATSYHFAFKPLSEANDGGLSQPLLATTPAQNTLSITKQPQDFYYNAEIPDNRPLFKVTAADSGDNRTISYQWQEYQAAGTEYLGTWENVSGATDESFAPAFDPNTATDGTRYRCRVSSVPISAIGHPVPQEVYSRAATLHLGTDTRFTVALTAHPAGGGIELPRESGGAYFLPKGTQTRLVADVNKAGTDKQDIDTGTVALFARLDGGEEQSLAASASGLEVTDGTASYEWTPAESGYYELIAVYTAPAIQRALAPPPAEEPETPPEPSAPAPPSEETGVPEEPESSEAQENPEDPESPDEPENPQDPDIPEEPENPQDPDIPEKPENPQDPDIPEEPVAPDTPEHQGAPETPAAAPQAIPAVQAALPYVAVSDPVALHVGAIRDEVYFVRYELDGGTNSPKNPQAIGKNAEPVELADPVRPGAAFGGWYEDAAVTASPVTHLDPARMPLGGAAQPYVLYAKWTPTSYAIEYVLHEPGSEIYGTNHSANPDVYTLFGSQTLHEPTRPGYRFTGWFIDKVGGSAPHESIDAEKPVTALPLLNKDGNYVAGALTLRAGWEAIAYPIIYYTPLAAGKGENPDTYTVEDTPLAINVADYNGTNFIPDGWYTDPGYKNDLPNQQIAKGSTGALSLFAKPKIGKSIVFFFPLGGEYGGQNPMTTSNSVDLGSATRQGFEFAGWSENAAPGPDGELVADPDNLHTADSSYTPPKPFNMLYAAWNANPKQVELHWLDPLDDEELYLNHGVQGGKIEKPELNPAHYGYAFDGSWYTDKALTRPWDFAAGTLPAGESTFTLYAGMRETLYDVKFEANGGPDVPSQRVREGQAATEPKAPVWQNHIFLGWHTDEALANPFDFESEVQSHLTLYAKWRGRSPASPTSDDDRVLGIEPGGAYTQGSTLTFTAAGAGMDNTAPIEEDERHVPQAWAVNPSGAWEQAPYTASFETRGMALGEHTLTVTFALERYEDGEWHSTGETVARVQIAFQLVEAQAAVGIPQTGDISNILSWIIAVLVALSGLGGLLVWQRKEKEKEK